jgi:hypothetical protein
MGALRVEVRGWRNGERHVEVLGIADRLAQLAGAVAATAARGVIVGGFASGARTLGDIDSPNEAMINDVLTAGLQLREFVGTAQ